MVTGRLAAIVFALSVILSADAATAHPLGNFSISHYTAIRVGKDSVELKYIIDMAEIPTFQEIQESGIVPQAGDASLKTYLARKAAALRNGLALEFEGKAVSLQVDSQEVIFPAGAGGLPTMKIGVVYKAGIDMNSKTGEGSLNYRDGNFPGRAGWKEIVALGESGVRLLNSSVPEIDRSAQLSNYPTDLLNSPPQQLEARVDFAVPHVASRLAAAGALPAPARNAESAISGNHPKPPRSVTSLSQNAVTGGVPAKLTPVTAADRDAGSNPASNNASARLQANRQATPRNSFTEIMATKQLGFGIILVAFAVAVGLGAFHALEPGHGKTLVAAYLVGSRGTMKDALLLGSIVTATHTAGVYLLGGVTLYASRYIVPDRLYPWLGVISGVVIAALGLALLVRRYLGKDAPVIHHHHGPAHHHHHHHRHDHEHHHDGERNQNVSPKQLLALGVSGGIVPCPAALVVLLSAVSMQRIGFGLLLIVAFSIGLAAVLITIGLLMVSARQFMTRFQTDSRVVTHWLPLTSSAFILLIGVALTVQALQSTGILGMPL
jgi:ABC-type nickel/cobalt efflux system permease component RcnA